MRKPGHFVSRIFRWTKPRVILILFSFIFFNSIHADVVTEGEFNRQFRIINADQYPDYTFYILYQTYYYDMGYQPGDVNEMIIKPGEAYYGGDRGGVSRIYGKSNSGNPEVATSEETVGGNVYVTQSGVQGVIDEIKITGIKAGVITFVVVKTLHVLDGGKEKAVKKGAFPGFGDGNSPLIFVLPGICLALLIGFLLFRNMKTRKSRDIQPTKSQALSADLPA